LGGTAGIARRCDSQIAVLNRDFNRQNADSVSILTGFKPQYASVGIQFGLAHTDPNGYATPGYDVRIISDYGIDGAATSYAHAKYTDSGGITAWDVSKYLNVWCINFKDYPGLIGLTVARSFVDSGWYPIAEAGICLTYDVFGRRVAATDFYPDHFDLGRSLTHEVGHYFEIWHPWGDDGGLCPGTGGKDDGIADTPPEAGNASGSPTGSVFDACSPSGNGIMWMNYMDYCNDDAVHMFTTDQAAVMAAQVAPGGESYTLTQNPGLLGWGIEIVEGTGANGFSIFPNPAHDRVNISMNNANELKDISLTNMIGKEVFRKNVDGNAADYYSLDLQGISKGVYVIKCNFASGSIIRKIVLQ
jgi:hypothetical protein